MSMYYDAREESDARNGAPFNLSALIEELSDLVDEAEEIRAATCEGNRQSEECADAIRFMERLQAVRDALLTHVPSEIR